MPALNGSWDAAGSSIDHNQYVRGNFTYQANYARGLRILELTDLSNASLSEVGFFDTYPESDGNSYNGAWSTYPFFGSGIALVSDINRGLFILQRRCRVPGGRLLDVRQQAVVQRGGVLPLGQQEQGLCTQLRSAEALTTSGPHALCVGTGCLYVKAHPEARSHSHNRATPSSDSPQWALRSSSPTSSSGASWPTASRARAPSKLT